MKEGEREREKKEFSQVLTDEEKPSSVRPFLSRSLSIEFDRHKCVDLVRIEFISVEKTIQIARDKTYRTQDVLWTIKSPLSRLGRSFRLFGCCFGRHCLVNKLLDVQLRRYTNILQWNGYGHSCVQWHNMERKENLSRARSSLLFRSISLGFIQNLLYWSSMRIEFLSLDIHSLPSGTLILVGWWNLLGARFAQS